MARLIAPLFLIAGVSGARVKRRTVHSSRSVSNTSTCDGFENVEVRGKNVGHTAAIICKFWPKSKLGDFPYESVDKLRSVADTVLGQGGLYDQVNKVWEDRNSNPDVCYRRFLFPSSSSLLATAAIDDDEDIDLFNLPGTMRTVDEASLSQAGTNNTAAWEDCPTGYKKAPLAGWMMGLCKTTCETPPLEHECDLTCTRGWWSCTKNVLNQVDAMAELLGKIASFVFGNPAISAAVSAVIDLTDFVVKVLKTVIAAVKAAFAGSDSKESTATLIMTMYQLVLDNADFLGETADTLKEKMGHITELITDVLHTGFNSDSFSWDALKEKILNSGSDIMESTLSITDAFLQPRCTKP